MGKVADVVIVGGGVVGCATAYLLAKSGVPATLVEREAIGSCASGFAAGLLDPLHGYGIPGPLERFTQESFRMHTGLADELKADAGVDLEYGRLPSLWVALNDAEAQELEEIYELAIRAEGFSTRQFDAEEARSLEPRLSSGVLGAVCVEGMRQVASYEYTLALAKAAEKHGATVRCGTVQGLRRSNGRVSGVSVDGEEIATEKVVLAMGPWTEASASWLDFPVPVGPLKGQILRLDLAGPPLKYVLYRCGGGYVSSKPDGLIWVGTTEERVGFDDCPTMEARESIMREAVEIMPKLSEARLVRQTACLRPACEDGLPIIGEVPGWQGVYLATGAGRKGILLAPAMARAVSDLITCGHTSLPIDGFSPGRFADASRKE